MKKIKVQKNVVRSTAYTSQGTFAEIGIEGVEVKKFQKAADCCVSTARGYSDRHLSIFNDGGLKKRFDICVSVGSYRRSVLSRA